VNNQQSQSQTEPTTAIAGTHPAHPPTTKAHTPYKKHMLRPTSKKQPALPVSPKVDPITPAPETMPLASDVQPPPMYSIAPVESLAALPIAETNIQSTKTVLASVASEVQPKETSSAITNAQAPVEPIEYTSNPPLRENST